MQYPRTGTALNFGVQVEKSLSPDSTTARMQKNRHKEASRHAAPDARKRVPTDAAKTTN
jgi:hypothetical protein